MVGPKPKRSNGLNNYLWRDEEIRRLADQLWGACDGVQVKENEYGKGKIVWGRPLCELMMERGIGPDFTFTSDTKNCDLDFIHRKTKNEDIYFIYNKTAEWIEADCAFRVSNKMPELWDPDTGSIRKMAVFENEKAITKLTLQLPPSGSIFVVFREETYRDHFTAFESGPKTYQAQLEENKQIELRVCEGGEYIFADSKGNGQGCTFTALPDPIELDGPWTVTFPTGWGAPPEAVFPELVSWTDREEEGIKYFSGIAAYHKEFYIPEQWIAPDRQLELDLGAVKDIADINVNGQPLGILWKPPFRVDITSAVKAGKNELLIEIANQWSNRLVGDSQLPEEKRYTHTNITYSIMYKRTWEKTPLQESGLLGPVRIHPARTILLNISE